MTNPIKQLLFSAARLVSELRGNGVIIINPKETPEAQQTAIQALADLDVAVAKAEARS